ncbi:hypothetical protein HBB16_20075 [Pseudonocardia sp. MCCB 268]|nr:hypothetical protein [Pseudonocardia cytotoxica]
MHAATAARLLFLMVVADPGTGAAVHADRTGVLAGPGSCSSTPRRAEREPSPDDTVPTSG